MSKNSLINNYYKTILLHKRSLSSQKKCIQICQNLTIFSTGKQNGGHNNNNLASLPSRKRKGKTIETKSAEVIKKLIDGFFEPWDRAIKGGTKAFSENPIFKSLRCYAEHKLNMDHAMFNRFWSEKMSSAKLTVKRLEEARK